MINFYYTNHSFSDVEKEYEETERRLLELSSELQRLNCEMQVHLQVRTLIHRSYVECIHRFLATSGTKVLLL